MFSVQLFTSLSTISTCTTAAKLELRCSKHTGSAFSHTTQILSIYSILAQAYPQESCRFRNQKWVWQSTVLQRLLQLLLWSGRQGWQKMELMMQVGWTAGLKKPEARPEASTGGCDCCCSRDCSCYLHQGTFLPLLLSLSVCIGCACKWMMGLLNPSNAV